MVKYILVLVMAIALLAVGCTTSNGNGDGSTVEGDGDGSTVEETGTLVLRLTDATVDEESIAGVYITVNEVKVNKSTAEDSGWTTLEGFEGPQEYNLLLLTDGNVALLGEFDLTAGKYNQIRFILDIQEQGQQPPTNPGCYVEFTDELTGPEPLFVPSGGQTGYKVVGAFVVPANGQVDVTVDFDVRKALHKTGQGNNQRYILRPTLRLVDNSQAGNIDGTITNNTAYADIIVFAYEEDEWAISEADDPDEGESRFPNAVTSAMMGDDGGYVLAYLAYETYDLVVVGYDDETYEVLGIVSGVELDSNHTLLNIDTDSL